MTSIPTHACLLTPLGRSAVAVIEVRGPAAQSLIAQRFLPANRLPVSQWHPGQLVYGLWRDDLGEEDLVVTQLGVDHFEIQCHGGLVAPQRILEDLEQAGCLILSLWQRMQQQYESTLAAEVAWQLGSADNRWAEQLLNWQLSCGLALALDRWLEILGSVASTALTSELESVQAEIRAVLSQRNLVRRAFCGVGLALIGQANVGKSSLVNRILGYERSLVFDLPGTTRDVVEARTTVDGWTIQVIDTAGERESPESELEALGQTRGRKRAAQADLVARLIAATTLAALEGPECSDATPISAAAGPSSTLEDFAYRIQQLKQRSIVASDKDDRDGVVAELVSGAELGDPSILEPSHRHELWLLLSKGDLLPWDWLESQRVVARESGNSFGVPMRGDHRPAPIVLTSATRADGLESFWEALSSWLNETWPKEPVAVATTQRQVALLLGAYQAIVARDLRRAHELLTQLLHDPAPPEPQLPGWETFN